MATTRIPITPHWQEIAKRAQEYCDATINLVEPSIPKVPAELPLDVTAIPRNLLSPEELDITQLGPAQLVISLASGQLRSVEVITAFLQRAGIAQRLVR